MRFRYPDSRYCYFRVLCFRIHHLQDIGFRSAGHQYSTGISYHAEAEGKHFGVGGIALFSTVPAAVIVGTVGVIPAVCFVVFFIVGIKIIHGEAIVAGKEIDTGIVSCIIVIMIRIKASVQITGTGNTPCSVPGIPEISLQEGTEQSR